MKLPTPLKLVFELISPSPRCDEIGFVLVDQQKHFTDPKGSRGNETTDAVAKKNAATIPLFRNKGMKVYAVHDTVFHSATAPNFHEFTPQPEDQLIPKNKDSAFEGSNIDATLKKDGRKMLLVAGFNASGCELETTLDAVDKGYTVIFLTDLSANDDESSVHCAGKINMLATAELLKQKGVILATSGEVLHSMTEVAKKNRNKVTADLLTQSLQHKNTSANPLPATLVAPPSERANCNVHTKFSHR